MARFMLNVGIVTYYTGKSQYVFVLIVLVNFCLYIK